MADDVSNITVTSTQVNNSTSHIYSPNECATDVTAQSVEVTDQTPLYLLECVQVKIEPWDSFQTYNYKWNSEMTARSTQRADIDTSSLC